MTNSKTVDKDWVVTAQWRTDTVTNDWLHTVKFIWCTLDKGNSTSKFIRNICLYPRQFIHDDENKRLLTACYCYIGLGCKLTLTMNFLSGYSKPNILICLSSFKHSRYKLYIIVALLQWNQRWLTLWAVMTYYAVLFVRYNVNWRTVTINQWRDDTLSCCLSANWNTSLNNKSPVYSTERGGGESARGEQARDWTSQGANAPGGKRERGRISPEVKEPGGKKAKGQTGKGAKKP